MKKLQLNKEIIANLTSDSMNQVVGGNCTCVGCAIGITIKTVDCEVLSVNNKCVIETHTCQYVTDVCTITSPSYRPCQVD
jgi:hypothetical protein